MADPLDFTSKIVLVTGSSRGIGAEWIKAFGARGAQCDVTQPQQVEATMKQIQDRHGGLDILVNNSGIIADRTIRKMALADFENVIRVNLTGTFIVTKKAAAVLRDGGRIVNLSSVSGQMGLFGQANYSSS